MKKIYLFPILFFVSFLSCNAQYLLRQPITDIFYGTAGVEIKQIMIIDSLLYTIRDYGLEEINVNSKEIKYHFANHYQLRCVVPDTGNTYVYLKYGTNYIGRFNKLHNRYENIWNDNLNLYLNDIDVAPDGKVWAVTNVINKDVAIYDGTKWDIYHFNGYLYSGFNSIKVVNDTLAYLQGNKTFFAFHKGVFDTVYTLNSNDYLSEWDADHNGNLWIGARTKLIHVLKKNITVIDSSKSNVANNVFLIVKIANNGHVWASGNGNSMYEFDGNAWKTYRLPANHNIENFTINKTNSPFVISTYYGSHLLDIYKENQWSSINFPFMPLNNLKAMNIVTTTYEQYAYFATGEGIYRINIQGIVDYNGFNFYLADFKDSTYTNSTNTNKYINDVTCFIDNENTGIISYGTHHGLFDVYNNLGFNNAELPNKNVNHICNNGSYYIATDSGLVVYNGIFYNLINTSNSPIPSDKITYVTTASDYSNNFNGTLYVGTDKGLALYNNSKWTVFNKTNIPVTNFYVTGIYKAPYDSSIFISTLGSGLIKLYPKGDYQIFNSSNGKLIDDSLYYIKAIQLGECGYFIAMGTKHHGVAFSGNYHSEPYTFSYDSTYYGNDKNRIIKSSRLIATSDFINLIATDSLIFALSPCGTINEHHAEQQLLKWYQLGNELIIEIPKDVHDNGNIVLTDMVGKTLINKDCNSSSGNIKLDISNISNGIYIIRLSFNYFNAYSKISISH